MNNKSHVPVMLDEVLKILQPYPDQIYIDGTFGRGGYSHALLAHGARVLAIDRDIQAIEYAKQYFTNNTKFRIVHDKFSNIKNIIKNNTDFIQTEINGIVLDLGFCTDQITSDRLSFHSEQLDMSMGLSDKSTDFIVNKSNVQLLSDVIFKYGEERRAHYIANLIVKHRPIHSNKQLSSLIAKHIFNKKIHSATKTFQAIRIYVNDELNELHKVLHDLYGIKKIIAISFHSLEDRIIKRFFTPQKSFISYKMAQDTSANIPDELHGINPQQYSAKLILPSAQEIIHNRQARSAKLRYGILQDEK